MDLGAVPNSGPDLADRGVVPDLKQTRVNRSLSLVGV
jgi:hypothetical protein